MSGQAWLYGWMWATALFGGWSLGAWLRRRRESK